MTVGRCLRTSKRHGTSVPLSMQTTKKKNNLVPAATGANMLDCRKRLAFQCFRTASYFARASPSTRWGRVLPRRTTFFIHAALRTKPRGTSASRLSGSCWKRCRKASASAFIIRTNHCDVIAWHIKFKIEGYWLHVMTFGLFRKPGIL